ncbi:acyl-phosphate glycerol 3-phosphate acyltransferase [Sphingomonas sp. Leaf339]|uniref:lysophospholipid acyltransferase family protein n=1 Tax=Sphingomonas sp. Leaf339 TaxID=1736343 RepID=UPI0006FC1E6D|nr:lysophospholipid acyltransferase family protein [Sphingomonas sp. Leaf339]KQU62104.1 acyl-phosphate glycerol 3-phosphate acyltransferase [Sphingomonas sp. Leaf339]
MGNVRLVGRLLALIVALAIGLPLHGAWQLRRRPSPWPRRFLATSAWIIGARPRVVGVPVARDVVVLANHLWWMDILLLAGSANAVFVAKGELRAVPLVGWLASLNDTIFVARGDRMAVSEQVADVSRAIGPRPVVIFPEGTTGDGRTLLPFKSALLGAIDPPPPGVHVQPVGIDYGAATADLAWTGNEPGLSHALRLLRRAGHFTATLRFHQPFVPIGRKATAAEARRLIEAGGRPSLSDTTENA